MEREPEAGPGTVDTSDLSLDRIAEAAETIAPLFRDTPQWVDEQLCARLGRRVLVKAETLNPLRSFKGRGADYLVSRMAPGTTVVCGSSGGNFGQAVSWAARRHGLRAEVFVPADIAPVKLRRTADLGGRVHPVDGDVNAAAEAYAAEAADRVFVVDGREAAIAEGAGTIGVELLATGGFDTVVLPVGDGALITGVARWLKAHAPQVRVVGVAPAAAPALARSHRTGRVLEVEPSDAFAAGITVRRPTPEAVRRTRALVDEILLVEGEQLRDAMRLAAETLGLLPEPAGAAGLAALLAHCSIPGETVATVLTGANVDPADVAALWHAPSGDGRDAVRNDGSGGRTVIRAGRATDAARLSALALRSKAHWGYDDAFLAACREELTMRPDEIVARRTLVAERDGEPLGFVTVDGAPPRGELGMLFVEPAAIGQGVGRRLFAAALDTARAAGFARLTVQADPHAEGFYRAMGAERIGEVPSGSVPGRYLPLLELTVT